MRRFRLRAMLAISLSALGSVMAFAAPAASDSAGVAADADIADSPEFTAPDLVFGMSTALSGPAADLGRNVRAGFEAAFARANRAGGIRGRRLRLEVLDDGYEPGRTIPNVRQFADDPRILGIVGNVGTPTAIAALPITNGRRLLFFGAYTGAGVLRRDPPDRYVINYRASYAEETAAMVDALIGIAGFALTDIAFFTQRDGYGDAGYLGGIEALGRYGLSDDHLIAHGRYDRNTVAIENGLADILSATPTPRAVILVGAYAPCAEFIRQARAFELDAVFLNVSFVGSSSLARELGPEGDGVIVTQVVPHVESDEPIAREFRESLRALDPALAPTFGALEGYTAARILTDALDRFPGAPDRETVIDALEALGEFDGGVGSPLRLTTDDHQASHRVWPTVLREGGVVPFAWENLSGVGS